MWKNETLEPTSLPHLHPPPWFFPCVLYSSGFSWGGVEGWGEKAYNCNWITIKIKNKIKKRELTCGALTVTFVCRSCDFSESKKHHAYLLLFGVMFVIRYYLCTNPSISSFHIFQSKWGDLQGSRESKISPQIPFLVVVLFWGVQVGEGWSPFPGSLFGDTGVKLVCSPFAF